MRRSSYALDGKTADSDGARRRGLDFGSERAVNWRDQVEDRNLRRRCALRSGKEFSPTLWRRTGQQGLTRRHGRHFKETRPDRRCGGDEEGKQNAKGLKEKSSCGAQTVSAIGSPSTV
ncbi:hypothetical protein ERJ75_000364900 [Trypanosoma vivax]|nr:hypothetical protein ERJ75_000364900 [Trypanosoma vivax]